MLRFARLILVLALTSALTLPCGAANLLTNPGFELGPSGAVPTGWTRWNATWSSGYSATADSNATYSGTYGLNETITGNASFGVYQQVSVAAGTAHKLNGMWKAVTAGSSNWFEIILIDGAFNITQADSGSGMTVYNNVVAGWDPGALFNHLAPASWAWQPFSATYGNDVSPYIDNGVRTASGSTMTVVLKIGSNNSSTKPTVYFDDITLTTVPKATVSGPSTPLTRTGPVSFTVTFSEPITGFDSAADVQVNATGGAAAGSVAVAGSGSGPYTVTLLGISGSGTLGITVKADSAQCSDGNGNLASGASTTVRALASDGSIASAKGLADGASVELAGKTLYLKWPGFGYIEETDRTNGIRVEGAVSANQGYEVLLVGTLHKPAGQEPSITVATMVSGGAASVVPLGSKNSSLGSGMLDGLFVTAWGKVTSVGTNSYVIKDGSNDAGITVNTQAAPASGVGDSATVRGAAGISGAGRVIYAR